MPSGPVLEFDRVVRTVCSPNCMGTCGVNAFVKDDQIVKLEPASFPDPEFERICLKGIAMATQRLHHAGRLTHPMIRTGERGAGQWRKVSWGEAYEYIVGKLTTIAAEHGWRAASWINASGNYGYKCMTAPKRLTNCLGGTHFTSAGLNSDWAGLAAYYAALGSVCCANSMSDVVNARYVLNIGKNLADTAHSDMHFLFDAMERGCKVVAVDPRFSRTAAKADEWISIRPGTDTALAMGLINVIVNEGFVQEEYVAAHTNLPFLVRCDTRALLRERDCLAGGSDVPMIWDAASTRAVRADAVTKAQLSGRWQIDSVQGGTLECRTAFDMSWDVWKDFTPEHAATVCDVPAAVIRRIAREYASNDPAWIWIGLGPQRYAHGHLTHRAFITLAALCGNIGKAFAGVNCYDGPLLQMFGTPDTGWLSPGGRQGHSQPGTVLVDMVASGKPYPIKSLWISATGFASQTPYFDRFVREALPNLDLYVASEQVMTDAASYADVVLPVVSYFEDDWDLVPGGEHWFLQLRRRAVPPVGESRNDFEIFGGLCEHLGIGAEHWRMDPEDACKQILASHPLPMFNRMDWEQLKRDGVAHVAVERPYIPFKEKQFPTGSGRIELYQEQFADLGEEVLVYKEPLESNRSDKARRYPLNLITYKHVHSVHGTHVMLPYIHEVLPGPRIEISPLDAAPRGIEDQDEVLVFNDRGRFRVRASVSHSVPQGTLAMTQGWWRGHFGEGHPQDLTQQLSHNEAQARLGESNWAPWDMLCDVRKAEVCQ
ncbi:MAG: molybdopterin-dependent oxidoreductase [Steroidobacteraceae bacterium]